MFRSQIDIAAFIYEETPDIKSPPELWAVAIPTEKGWEPPLVLLKPVRFVLKLNIQAENYSQEKSFRMWIKESPQHGKNRFELSMSP